MENANRSYYDFTSCQLRGHLQTIICTLNVIVTLRGWGGLGRDVNNFILMQQNGNEAKTNGVLTCLLYTL